MGLPGKPDRRRRERRSHKYAFEIGERDIAQYGESDVAHLSDLAEKRTIAGGTLQCGIQTSDATLASFLRARSNVKPHLAELT